VEGGGDDGDINPFILGYAFGMVFRNSANSGPILMIQQAANLFITT
jgi:hypothetical protein